MTQQHHPEGRPTVLVTVDEGWHEQIPRGLAVERLNSRPLASVERQRIADTIPEVTHTYLTFAGRAFREYVDFGEGFAHIALFLPMEVTEEGYRVIVPIYRSQRFSDGRRQNLIGIDEHLFGLEREQLVQNGKERPTFEPIREPVALRVEATMLMPDRGHPGGSVCCDACEWVHSGLDIHCADWLCCLGCC